MGRKKQNPEDSKKRSQILKVAAKMFMSQGFASVSMDALADAVPVSKRTLYNHFKDKKSLFTSVMENRCNLLFNQLEQSIRENLGVEETLTSIGRKFLDLVMQQDSVNIYRTAITESQHFPELGRLMYESGPKRSRAIIAQYLQQQNDKGKLKIDNPELAASMFLSMLKGNFHMQRMLGVKKNLTEKEKEDILHYAVKVFLYGQLAR